MEYIEEIQERVILVGVQLDENDDVSRKFDSLFSSNTSQSLYWLYFFVKIKFYLYTLHYVVV